MPIQHQAPVNRTSPTTPKTLIDCCDETRMAARRSCPRQGSLLQPVHTLSTAISLTHLDRTDFFHGKGDTSFYNRRLCYVCQRPEKPSCTPRCSVSWQIPAPPVASPSARTVSGCVIIAIASCVPYVPIQSRTPFPVSYAVLMTVASACCASTVNTNDIATSVCNQTRHLSLSNWKRRVHNSSTLLFAAASEAESWSVTLKPPSQEKKPPSSSLRFLNLLTSRRMHTRCSSSDRFCSSQHPRTYEFLHERSQRRSSSHRGHVGDEELPQLSSLQQAALALLARLRLRLARERPQFPQLCVHHLHAALKVGEFGLVCLA